MFDFRHKNRNLRNFFRLLVQVTPVATLVERFKSRLAVVTFGKNTSVIELSLVDPVRAKAEDFLNTLIKNVESYYEEYEPTKAAREISEFVQENLSNWYVRLCRRRFWKGE